MPMSLSQPTRDGRGVDRERRTGSRKWGSPTLSRYRLKMKALGSWLAWRWLENDAQGAIGGSSGCLGGCGLGGCGSKGRMKEVLSQPSEADLIHENVGARLTNLEQWPIVTIA